MTVLYFRFVVKLLSLLFLTPSISYGLCFINCGGGSPASTPIKVVSFVIDGNKEISRASCPAVRTGSERPWICPASVFVDVLCDGSKTQNLTLDPITSSKNCN